MANKEEITCDDIVNKIEDSNLTKDQKQFLTTQCEKVMNAEDNKKGSSKTKQIVRRR